MVELSVISKLLQQLLCSNKRVSLPGLGAFKVEYTPAAFINGGQAMSPPSNHIDFSSAEIWNDNLLEDALSKEQGCSFEEAKQQLVEFVGQIEETLNRKQPVVFPGLGKLSLTNDEEYRFEGWKNEQINTESFGLTTIEMVAPQPSTETAPQQVIPPQVVVEPDPIVPPIIVEPLLPPIVIDNRPIVVENPKEPRSHKWRWILITIAVLAVCLFIFRKPVRTIFEKMYYGEGYETFLEYYKK